MRFILLIILFLLPSPNIAKRFEMSLDGSVFRQSDSTSLWELYYTFKDAMMTYQPTDSGFQGEYFFEINISQANKKIIGYNWIISNTLKSIPLKDSVKDLLGIKAFSIPHGILQAELKITDLFDSTIKEKVQFNINSRKIPLDKISLSDIEFAYTIESESTPSANWNRAFNKNSLYVVPNPTLEVIGSNGKIKAYCELYNAKKASPEGYTLRYEVDDRFGKELFKVEKQMESHNDGIVEIVDLPADGLSTGQYFLKITAIGNRLGIHDTTSVTKSFFRINPDLLPTKKSLLIEGNDFELSEFSTLNNDAVNLEFRMAKNIASSFEIDEFRHLDSLKAKQRFLYRFWLHRDPSPNTSFNEKLDEFRSCINFANIHFSTGLSNNGWLSDRGRIVLTYGMPTKRDMFTSKPGYRAYETWLYAEKEGGLTFSFVEMHGHNNIFQLVNSNARGEFFDINWFEKYVLTDKSDPNVPQSNIEGR